VDALARHFTRDTSFERETGSGKRET